LGKGFNGHPLYSSTCSSITVIDDNTVECTIPPHVASTNNDITFTGNNLSFTFTIEYQYPFIVTLSIPSNNYTVWFPFHPAIVTDVNVDWGDSTTPDGHRQEIVSSDKAPLTYGHTYSASGVYSLKINSKEIFRLQGYRDDNDTFYKNIIAASGLDNLKLANSDNMFVMSRFAINMITFKNTVKRTIYGNFVWTTETDFYLGHESMIEKLDFSGSDFSGYSLNIGEFKAIEARHLKQIDMTNVTLPAITGIMFRYTPITAQVRCSNGVGSIPSTNPCISSTPIAQCQRPCLPFLTDSIVSVNVEDTENREVTITGTHYTAPSQDSSGTIVTIDGNQCIITSASESEIKCQAPRGTGLQSTVVLSNGLGTNSYTLIIDN
jgi:hypothetical protein